MNRPNTLEWRFKVQNNPIRSGEPGNVMSVSYTGVVPDTFKDEAEVVLKGRIAGDGFHTDPNGVIAKCPSKYEAAGKIAAGSVPAGS
jgi:cytochrome c-type biogenesis protein CcmE